MRVKFPIRTWKTGNYNPNPVNVIALIISIFVQIAIVIFINYWEDINKFILKMF